MLCVTPVTRSSVGTCNWPIYDILSTRGPSGPNLRTSAPEYTIRLSTDRVIIANNCMSGAGFPVKFHEYPFSGCRELENTTANKRPERPSLITDRHKKHKLGRVSWGLASCHALSKSIQQLQRRSQKIFQTIRGQGSHLGWPIGTKTQTW